MRYSVLMPVFNGAESLDLAIRSILKQSFKDFELIIVNDGSTDTTSSIARSVTDPRVRVIDLETNRGLINALNTGLAEARGELLARMDHDDIAHPKRLQLQADAMDDQDVVICGSAIQPFGAIGGMPITYPLLDAEIRAALPVVSPFAHPAVTMRTEVCRRLGYLPEAKYHEDYDLWWRMAAAGKMVNLAEPLLQYRFHPGQISASQRSTQLAGMAKVAADNLDLEGRFRTKSDLACHQQALSYARLASLDELAAMGDWLCWLRSSFDEAGEAVENHYLRVWRGICSRQGHLGARIWPIYKRFRQGKAALTEDVQVFLAAYTGISPEGRKVRALRRVFRR